MRSKVHPPAALRPYFAPTARASPPARQGAVGAASGALADRMISSGWDVRKTRVLLQVGEHTRAPAGGAVAPGPMPLLPPRHALNTQSVAGSSQPDRGAPADCKSSRPALQVVGMLGPAACLLAAVSPATGASAGAASALITVGLGLSALTLGGVSANHLDIAPRHAGAPRRMQGVLRPPPGRPRTIHTNSVRAFSEL